MSSTISEQFIFFLLVCFITSFSGILFGFVRKSDFVFLLEQINAETFFFGAPANIYWLFFCLWSSFRWCPIWHWCSQCPCPSRNLRFWEPGAAGPWPGRATGGRRPAREPSSRPLPVATRSFKCQNMLSWAPGCKLRSYPSAGETQFGKTTCFDFSVFRVSVARGDSLTQQGHGWPPPSLVNVFTAVFPCFPFPMCEHT